VETNLSIAEQVISRFGDDIIAEQVTKDRIVSMWLPLVKLKAVLFYVKNDLPQPYPLLYDLTAIDERSRK
jgi:NADH-quinone oxidoreductase subunit C/D